jgi:YebC/PmpR family DNA-binding regulatory protein
MSGHSKWSKVKHQKAVTDVQKASAFTRASHAITIAVREGGGVIDPSSNFRLRLAMEKARDVNMPKENIDRIIEKAKGGGEGDIVSAMYEAYGPGGVAMMIETTSDNANRIVSEVKNALDHHGGTMAHQGAVSYLFDRSGIVVVDKGNRSLDDMVGVVLDCGGEDVVETDEYYEIYTNVSDLAHVKDALSEKGIESKHTEIIMRPKNLIEIDESKRHALSVLEDLLEELDDVQHVFTNIA